jgi:hypothetical protein
MGVHEHLGDGERIVLQHNPFYLTTHRLLRCEDISDNDSFREIPLMGMTEVEELRVMDHRIMSVGVILVVSGVIIIATWVLFTAFLGVIAGVAALILGAKGKAIGYQVQSPRIPERELDTWRLPSWGTENFVSKLQAIAAENQDPFSSKH